MLTACAPPVITPEVAQPTATAARIHPAIANPASQNCVDQGGTLSFEERGDGGQFGVCYFEDNRQCEEWAMLRGDCPVGGLKVTGYITPAARYCAITGGEYAITGGSGAQDEQGPAPSKMARSVTRGFYNGSCTRGGCPSRSGDPTAGSRGRNGQAQAMAHFLDVLEVDNPKRHSTIPSPAQTAPAAWRRSQAPGCSSRARKRW
jgi:putative hemolysin